jgi:hypothetical protein
MILEKRLMNEIIVGKFNEMNFIENKSIKATQSPKPQNQRQCKGAKYPHPK